jgi:hypothetical protein
LIPNEEDAFRQIRRKHQFLEILRLLTHPVFNRRISERMVGDCLEKVALGGSRAEIRTALYRMEELGLLRCIKYDDHFLCDLTEKGERIALGKDSMEEVARPPLPE